MKFGVVYKILSIEREFCDKRLGGIYARINGLNNFLLLISIFTDQSGMKYLHVKPLSHQGFHENRHKERNMLHVLKGEKNNLPVVSAFVRFLIKFRAGDVKEIY
jgi:hypothetical protein